MSSNIYHYTRHGNLSNTSYIDNRNESMKEGEGKKKKKKRGW